MRKYNSILTSLKVAAGAFLLCALSCAGLFRETNFSGTITGRSDIDSVSLLCYSSTIATAKQTNAAFMLESAGSKLKNGNFNLSMPASQNLIYFSLYGGARGGQTRTPFFEYLLFQPGGNTSVRIDGKKVSFEGDCSEFLNCQVELIEFDRRIIIPENSKEANKLIAASIGYSSFDLFRLNRHTISSDFYEKIRILQKYRSCITKNQYMILMNNLRYQSLVSTWRWFKLRSGDVDNIKANKAEERKAKDSVSNLFHRFFYDSIRPLYKEHVIEDPIFKSREFIDYVLSLNEAYIYPDDGDSYKLLESISETCSESVTSLVSTGYILHRFPRFKDKRAIVNYALKNIGDSASIGILNDLITRIGEGTPAVDFKLNDVNGIIHTMSEYSGKVVLIDFWFTGCSACKDYYKNTLKEMEEKYPDVIFLTINVDRDVNTFIQTLKSGGYTNTTASNVTNLHTGIKGSTHEIIAHYNVSAYPHPLLFDSKHKLVSTSSRLLMNKSSLDSLLTITSKIK